MVYLVYMFIRHVCQMSNFQLSVYCPHCRREVCVSSAEDSLVAALDCDTGLYPGCEFLSARYVRNVHFVT